MKTLALLASLLLVAAAGAQDLTVYACLRTSVPPVIDGNGDEAVWQQAQPADMVKVQDLTRTQYHSQPTEVRLLWDAEALYVLIVATDPDVFSTLADRDDPLYNEEVVEVFIDPDGDERNYVEIEVNPLNALFDLLMTASYRAGGHGIADWSPEYATAVHVEGTVNDPSDADQSWSMEMALPWSVLHPPDLDVPGDRSLPPSVGDQWRMNFYRYERLRAGGEETGDIEYSAWSPTGAINFHLPARFGVVVFEEGWTPVAPSSWGQIKAAR